MPRWRALPSRRSLSARPSRPHNGLVEPDDLPDAEDLWWSWVVLAALHRAVGNEACRFDAHDLLLTLDSGDGSWLRMQRAHGSRAVLWGRSALAPPSHPDARRGVPDWALSPATDERRPTFLAWFAHGEWDTSAPCHDEGALHLLRPMLTVDPRIVELGRTGALTGAELAAYANGDHLEEAAEIIRLAAGAAPRRSRGFVRSRLRDQIHGQMRDTDDVDRELMQRPPILVQWSRANGPGVPFEYAVMTVQGRMVPSPANSRLATSVEHTLTNVLSTLHDEEASDESGAWLFARVTSDGVVVRFDRAFDGWPAWYQVRHTSQGPSLDDLSWEMAQRTRTWQPAWASLLPGA
jgi:hypothetical protein